MWRFMTGVMCAGMVALVVPDQTRGETASLTVRVHERHGRDLLPCRAWVTAGKEQRYKPTSPKATPYDRDMSFSCEGEFTIDVPVGEVVVHLERGKEYRPLNHVMTIKKAEPVEVDLELERWIDMPANGWYSAELHNHFGNESVEVLKQLARSDDIHWLPSFSYWNQFEKDWPEHAQKHVHRADGAHLVSLHNEEIERIGGEPFHSIGALFIFGLDSPLYVPRHDHVYPCDTVLARLAKATSPECVIDTDKPLWAENVVTMAFRLFDSVQVCHNHYHRRQTIHDGGLCCGMADDSLEEEKQNWGKNELFHRTNAIYYRWLNCGFKLAVSGGSAMGVMPVPPGYNRTYARIEGELTEANYRQAIREGKTLATSGPMLWLIADEKETGATLSRQVSDAEPIEIRAYLESIDKIDTLEIIEGGRVLKSLRLDSHAFKPLVQENLIATLLPRRSTWIAARAVYRAEDGYLRQAHTSPVYVTVDDKPIASKRDAEYMIRWIDRLLDVSNEKDRYAKEEDRTETQYIYRQARAIYAKIAQSAIDAWGD